MRGPRPIFKTGIRGQAPPKLDDPVVTTDFPTPNGHLKFVFVLRHTRGFQRNFGREFSRKSHRPASPPGSLLVLHQDPNAGSLRHHPRLSTPDSSDCRIEVGRDSRPLEKRGVCQSFEPAFGGIDAVRRLGKRIKAWNRSVYDPDREGQRSGHCGMIRPDRPVVRDESGFRP